MVAQTIILELGAKWQNAQMQVTQNESNRPFVFKVKTSEGGFVDLTQYNVKLAINAGTEALVYTVNVQHNTEGHVSIPSKATENPGTFDCWLVLIADDVEIRLDGLSMTVTPCNINSLVDSDTGDGGFFEELQEAADVANAAASTATSAAQAANTAADRANNIADSIEEAVDGTLINDSSASPSTVYSSKKIEDDFDEISIDFEGIMIIDNQEYQVFGHRENEENEEYEVETNISFNGEKILKVEQETEINENEYTYTYYQNNQPFREVSQEVETENGRREMSISVKEGNKEQEFEFTYLEGNKISCEYSLEEGESETEIELMITEYNDYYLYQSKGREDIIINK